MEVSGSALGHDAQLTAGRAAVLRGEVGRKYLDLLDGVHAGNTYDRAVGSGTNRPGAIKRNHRVLCARPVYLERLAAAYREVEIPKGRGGSDAGKKLRHVKRIAAVELLVLHLLPSHLGLCGPRLGLQRRGSPSPFGGLGLRTEREIGIDLDGAIGVQFVMGTGEFLE